MNLGAPVVATLGLALTGCELAFPDVVVDAGPGTSPVAFVQVAAGGKTVPFDQPQLAGDLNVVIIGWGDSTTRSVTGVSDTLGNTYELAAPPLVTDGTRQPVLTQAIYYAKNIQAGMNAVTIDFDVVPMFPDLRILEYAGAGLDGPLDVHAGQTGIGGGGELASVSFTTNFADERVVAGGMVTDRFSNAGALFTSRFITNTGNIVEDRFLPRAGTFDASAVLSGAETNTQQWVFQVATFTSAHSL